MGALATGGISRSENLPRPEIPRRAARYRRAVSSIRSGRPFRLGLNLPYVEGQSGGRTPRWADILAMARTAEEIGFDAVWISDHLGFVDGVGDGDGAWKGAWESWTGEPGESWAGVALGSCAAAARAASRAG